MAFANASFKKDQSQELELTCARGISRFALPLTNHSAGLQTAWRADKIQLGPSGCFHQYSLKFFLSLSTYDSVILPFFEVDIHKDATY